MGSSFQLPPATPRSSITIIAISGLEVYIYGLGELVNKSNVEIGVLYLAHGRTRSYIDTEDQAHEVLDKYRQVPREKKVELIAVAFDMRNHGKREISKGSNLAWTEGNEEHALDILSIIDGSALDFALIMSYLPAYLPQFTKFHNIMSGVSLGGHICWRIADRVPKGQIEGMIIIIGSPDVSSLLFGRLGVALPDDTQEVYKIKYSELEPVMTEQQKERWPKAFHEIIAEQDRKVADEFPEIPLLVMGGKKDTLVPVKYTEPWMKKRSYDEVEFFVQDNIGHACSTTMVSKMSAWLSNFFAVGEGKI